MSSSSHLYRKSSSYTSKLACSPGHKSEYDKRKSCFTEEGLAEIAAAWNRTYPDNKISDTNTKHVWNSIKDKIQNCSNEWCWLEQPFIKRLQTDKQLRCAFKPPMPKGKWQWLSTDDIEKSCKQYEEVEPRFKFLGAFPIDFVSVYYYIFGKFNPRDYLRQGRSKIGVVFNEDPHDQPGSHWIGLYLDLIKKRAYFFDSYGESPHPRVRKWVESLPGGFTLKHNRTQHQLKGSECGVYCVHFIVRMALGASFRVIEKDIIRDDKINRKRLEYFNPFEQVKQYW